MADGLKSFQSCPSGRGQIEQHPGGESAERKLLLRRRDAAHDRHRIPAIAPSSVTMSRTSPANLLVLHDQNVNGIGRFMRDRPGIRLLKWVKRQREPFPTVAACRAVYVKTGSRRSSFRWTSIQIIAAGINHLQFRFSLLATAVPDRAR